jgi:hypothetical protein
MATNSQNQSRKNNWPPRPGVFGELLTPIEAAQYLRLDETGNHSPQSAVRTLNYWRDKGQLKATKFVRRVWYLREELEKFLRIKTENGDL